MHDIAYLIKERERPKIKYKYVLQFDIKEQLRREYLKNMKMHIVFSEISCFTQMNINQLLQQRCLKEEKKNPLMLIWRNKSLIKEWITVCKLLTLKMSLKSFNDATKIHRNYDIRRMQRIQVDIYKRGPQASLQFLYNFLTL